MNEQKLDLEIIENKSVNRMHSLILVASMLAIMCTVGYLTFGPSGFLLSIVFTIGSCLMGQRVTTAWILRMYKASEIRREQAPALYAQFRELAKSAQLKHVPKLFYIPTRMPNAFAIGHDQTAAIAMTDGILRLMNSREINGILAHEMAHLMHRNTKVLALADTMARLTAMASRFGFFLILISGFFALLNSAFSMYYVVAFLIMFISPTLMILLQLALSRSREFNADLGALQLTGDAVGLASALSKLERLTKNPGVWRRVLRPGPNRSQPAFLRTHPPTKERIEQLMENVDNSHTEKYKRRHALGKQENRADKPTKIALDHPRIRPRPRYRASSGLWH